MILFLSGQNKIGKGKVMSEVKILAARDFYKIDLQNSTLLDVREPSEVIVRPINGAVQVPFFELSKKVDSIPKDKPVYVFCSTGDRSEQVAEILADRDYEVYNLEGGLEAFSKVHFVDAKGNIIPGANYPVNMPVATGNISKEYAAKQLTEFACFLRDNSFWNKQVEQVNVVVDRNNKRVVEIVPRVGNHIVYLGSIKDYQKKLKRLRTFYEKAMKEVGWNKYKRINLEFDNQIICTKK